MGKVKIEKDTAERWLLTYADLMNLLLVFFIVLYAMSQVDAAKYSQLAQSLKASLGDSSAASNFGPGGSLPTILNYGNTGADAALESVVPSDMEKEQMEKVQDKVTELVEKSAEALKGNVEVSMEERGVVISIKSQAVFASGSADIANSSVQILKDIGDIVKLIPGNQIKVEGHTDTDPIKTSQFPSNWELSSARATNVLRLLVDNGINPDHISAVGYGEFRPKVPNDSSENKAINRRVNIVIVKSAYNKDEPEVGAKKEN